MSSSVVGRRHPLPARQDRRAAREYRSGMPVSIPDGRSGQRDYS
ncbi:hypothetical protein C7S14_7960 [Burkholderia cepacia]|nr:hypothetical protein C7S14_7960 [Burkholderia cepacia]